MVKGEKGLIDRQIDRKIDDRYILIIQKQIEMDRLMIDRQIENLFLFLSKSSYISI